MRVFTPGESARHTGSKYLGVLVAAKHARDLNELRRGEMLGEDPTPAESARREKLTTVGLRAVASGTLQFQLTPRRRNEL